MFHIRVTVFQSPSLRGSGRFAAFRSSLASRWHRFQSPSLRGSGRFSADGCMAGVERRRVSIPFIAGQWSLLRDYAKGFTRSGACFNPLHCGAVVASRRARRMAGGCGACFNFIAGQWSLPDAARSTWQTKGKFQSPSLRGSGRFYGGRGPRRIRCGVFQSPSLRGSGRFMPGLDHTKHRPECFNPLHCGAVVASHQTGKAVGRIIRVSIPFIAGQWSLPMAGGCRRGTRTPSFNPLHCGAVVASRGARRGSARNSRVSIPFIAGQWSLLPYGRGGGASGSRFNPLHCGAVVASGAARDRGEA